MIEQHRLATLEAMGIAVYVSRSQLPGAAPTRRLAVVPQAMQKAPSIAMSGPSVSVDLPNLPAVERPAPVASRAPAGPIPDRSPPPRFSLAAIVAGGWLWLEEMETDTISQEQLQLVRAMATALAVAAATGDRPPQHNAAAIEYFNWPLNSSPQLDHGAEAARWGVAGYLRQRLVRDGCRGLVLLGEACRTRVPVEQIDCERVVCTLGTATMLANPLSKQQVWLDLKQHCLAD